MKSTTLRRSNITKEKVAMMEALNRYNREHQDEDFYKTQTKSRELDALWQSFGVKSPKSETAAGLLRTAAPLVDVGCEREGYGYLKREWRQGWPPSHVLQR